MTGDPTPWEDIAEFIQDAAQQMREFGLTTLDVEHDGTRVRMKIAVPHSGHPVAPVALGVVPTPTAPNTASRELITAPMIGTFYASPTPGDPPFVTVGDEIEIGQVIGIIEAMKIMNEIPSDRAGTVQEVLVKNSQAVEYGQPLVRVSPFER